MDMNQRAFRTVALATGQAVEEKPKGRARGIAAAASMTAEERRERAKKAAAPQCGSKAAAI